MKKKKNQLSNFHYVRTSFDLKMQYIVQTSNQRDYQKCWTNFYRESISRFGNY